MLDRRPVFINLTDIYGLEGDPHEISTTCPLTKRSQPSAFCKFHDQCVLPRVLVAAESPVAAVEWAQLAQSEERVEKCEAGKEVGIPLPSAEINGRYTYEAIKAADRASGRRFAK